MRAIEAKLRPQLAPESKRTYLVVCVDNLESRLSLYTNNWEALTEGKLGILQTIQG